MLVSIVKCENYSYKELEEAIRSSFDNIGGLKKFIKRGDRVLLKPNLLAPCLPEQHVTTHPMFVKVIAELVREIGGKVLIGDSPAGHATSNIYRIWEKTGMLEALKAPAEMAVFEQGARNVLYEKSKTRNFILSDKVMEADVIINIPKFKTHAGMLISGAIKNLFGAVPGRLKSNMHVRYQNVEEFAGMLVDIAELVRPAITIIDGVWGLEGDGPGAGGTPKKIGLILAGTEPLPIDIVMARLVGIDPLLVPTNQCAIGREPDKTGYMDKIEIIGEDLDKAVIPDFQFANVGRLDKEQENRVLLLDTRVPVVEADKCARCMVCSLSCPVDAIKVIDGFPAVDFKKCISCYCCFEVCTHSSIKLKRKYSLRRDEIILQDWLKD